MPAVRTHPTAARRPNRNIARFAGRIAGVDVSSFAGARSSRRISGWLAIAAGLLTTLAVGCGTTKSFDATEQLLLSEAVDNSISVIDFRPLAGQKIFFDTQFIRNVKALGFVNSDYVISSLRQQMTGAGCLLQDTVEQADLVVEGRCGTLGADSFQVTYGIPANSFLSNVAQTVPGAPPIPMIPDLSVARRESREGATKVAAFAYDRLTREAVWQSGTSQSSTTSRDTWILGIGPIQTGSIRRRTRWIGSGLEFGNRTELTESSPRNLYDRPPVNYDAEVRFDRGEPILGPRLNSPILMESEPIPTPAPEIVPETLPEPEKQPLPAG